MSTFKVTGSFCLEIEDVESEEDAKNAAFEQLSSCLLYQPFDAAFEVKAEEIQPDVVLSNELERRWQ